MAPAEVDFAARRGGGPQRTQSRVSKEGAMPQVGDNQLASLEFSLYWRSADAEHRERLYATKANFWRDIFPGDLRKRLEGLDEGRSARVDLPAGRDLPAASQPLDLPRRAFSGMVLAGRRLPPKYGRFYPRGRVSGLPGVFDVGDLRPLSVTALADGRLCADLSHPLSGRDLSLEATVVAVRPKPGDTGGGLHCWLEEAAGDGPGMQAALPAGPTDFGGEGALARGDESPDSLFYAEPRLVDHLDSEALAVLQAMYAARLKPGMRVLDLMAAQDSHLPAGLGLHVAGLGMNPAELAANPLLAERLVQDLNGSPALPFADGGFDAVLVSLSVEYLSRPLEVLNEAARVLAPGGRLLVSFSNRYFPTKAVRVWTELHDFERMGYVLGLLRATGKFADLGTESMRNRPRPAEDKYARAIRWSDPVYLVEARRKP